MLKVDKQKWVEKYQKVFQGSNFAFVFRCTKIPAEEMIALRKDIKTAGGNVAFVKNTLARVAVKGSDCESMSPLFKGVSVLVTASNKDDEESFPGIVKSLASHVKAHKDKLSLAGGVLQGKFLDKHALEEFGKMPSRMDLLSRIAFMCQYPLINVSDTIKRAGESK